MAVDVSNGSIEPTDTELLQLCDLLTTEEKISLLAAKSIWETPEIARLNIPALKVSMMDVAVIVATSSSRRHR